MVDVLPMTDPSWEAGFPGTAAHSDAPPNMICVTINGGDAVLTVPATTFPAGQLTITGQNRQWYCAAGEETVCDVRDGGAADIGAAPSVPDLPDGAPRRLQPAVRRRERGDNSCDPRQPAEPASATVTVTAPATRPAMPPKALYPFRRGGFSEPAAAAVTVASLYDLYQQRRQGLLAMGARPLTNTTRAGDGDALECGPVSDAGTGEISGKGRAAVGLFGRRGDLDGGYHGANSLHPERRRRGVLVLAERPSVF